MAKSTPRYHRSPQREAILTYLRARKQHLSAEEVYAGLRPQYPRLSMGTVYRNLHILVDQQKLRVIHFGSGQDRYDTRLDPHYHFLCRQCQDLCDLGMPVNADLERQVQAFAVGLKIEHHFLVFGGLCTECERVSTD